MFSHLKYNESLLSNGLRVLTAQSGLPAVDAQIWTRTGYRYENPDELGYAHLLEHMLMKGTKRFPTSELLALQVVGKGGLSNATTSQDAVAYIIQMMSEDTELMVDLLADRLFNSLIDEDVLENEKEVVLHELRMRRDNNDQYLFRLLQKKLFAGHPLSNNVLDTEQTTRAATSERLRAYLDRHYRPDQSALVLTGDVVHKDAVEFAERYFGHWQNPKHPFDGHYSPVTPVSERLFHEYRDTEQTFLAIGYYTESVSDMSVVAALEILQSYLGSKQTSVLYRKLRIERGLVYYVMAHGWHYDDAGALFIKTSTQKPEETLAIIEETVSEISEELSEELFERAQTQTIGTFALRMSKPDLQAQMLGVNFVEYDRLLSPDEWVQTLKSVTRESVLELAKKYLQPENSVLVSLGKSELKR